MRSASRAYPRAGGKYCWPLTNMGRPWVQMYVFFVSMICSYICKYVSCCMKIMSQLKNLGHFQNWPKTRKHVWLIPTSTQHIPSLYHPKGENPTLNHSIHDAIVFTYTTDSSSGCMLLIPIPDVHQYIDRWFEVQSLLNWMDFKYIQI